MIKGDHLVSSRIGYTHHGLYIGDGEVIHYSGSSDMFDKGSIEITSLNEFEQGYGSKIKRHLICAYDVNERVTRAFSKLSEDSYSLIFNNCEHFVNWCFNGIKTSSQVNNVAVAAALASECMKIKGAETVVSVIAQQTAKAAVTKTAEAAITSAVAKSAVSTTASTIAGMGAASAVTGTTTVSFVSAVAASSLAPAAAPIIIGVGVAYGVKKAIGWLLD